MNTSSTEKHIFLPEKMIGRFRLLYRKKKILPKIKIKKNYEKWIAHFQNWKEKYPIVEENYYKQSKNVNPYVFMLKLSEKTGKNDILIPDASANLIWGMQAFYLKGQRVFTALNHSPMGYSMPATIGAYMADKKNKNIICTIGDGSMQMNIQELATISHLKIPAKIFVLNNKGYGLIKQTQDMWLNSRRVGVDSKSDLAININENQNVVPKLQFGRPIHDLSPRLNSKEIESNINIKV